MAQSMTGIIFFIFSRIRFKLKYLQILVSKLHPIKPKSIYFLLQICVCFNIIRSDQDKCFSGLNIIDNQKIIHSPLCMGLYLRSNRYSGCSIKILNKTARYFLTGVFNSIKTILAVAVPAFFAICVTAGKYNASPALNSRTVAGLSLSVT